MAGVNAKPEVVKHFLLYLNKDTFVGSAGENLIRELRRAQEEQLGGLDKHTAARLQLRREVERVQASSNSQTLSPAASTRSFSLAPPAFCLPLSLAYLAAQSAASCSGRSA